MKTTTSISLLLAFGVIAGFGSCQQDKGLTPTGPIGTWRLTHRSCYCAPGPTPNEKLSFTATAFSFFRNDSLITSGTYTHATAAQCSGPQKPTLRLVSNQANWYPHESFYTLSGNHLVLDRNIGCLVDGPVETYELVP